MKLFVLVCLVGAAAAAQLPSNQYIPPQGNSYSAGAHSGPSNQYIAPSQSQYGGHQQQKEQIPILSYNNVNNGDGSYNFDYSTGNGIMHQEQGHVNNPGSEHSEQVVSGSYSYTGDDGKVYTVHYKADANGFQATGDHLPTPPPIPEAIQKSIAFNAQAQSQSHGSGSGSGSYNQGGHQQQGSYSQQGSSQQNSAGYHY